MTPALEDDGQPGAAPTTTAREPRGPVHTGGLLAAIVIFALGSGVALLLSQRVREDRALEIERQTQGFASALADGVESAMNADLEGLRRRVEVWSTPANEATGDRPWRRDAELFLADHPVFSALVRMRPGTQNEIAASPDGESALREVAPRILELVGESDAPGVAREAVFGPFQLSDGRVMLGMQVPLLPRDATSGVIFALLEPRVALEPVLQRRASGYSIVVRGSDAVLFERAADGVAQSPPAKSEVVNLALGSPWTIEVRPGAEASGGARADTAAVVLVAGLVISALVSSLVSVAQLSRGRARALELLNVELRNEVSTSNRGKDEIHRLAEALEARVQERTAELNETITELETFNYSVSHDLRSPLGAIINLAAILSEDHAHVLDADGREYLRRIVASASTAVSLMDALLAFSRSGRDEIHRTRVRMRRLVEEVAAELQAASPERACSFEIRDLPDANADPAMMRFIVTNLLNNACKFVHEGEHPHVEVGGYARDGETTFFVRDHGIGFDMKYADKLFKVFERLHSDESYGGHGVGLAIVARMVRRHGGRVWAQGALDKGATFYLSFPDASGGEHAGSIR